MDPESIIQQQANKCVKCGLCSTVCPTYTLAKEEGESPRGRIALMEGMVQEKLPINNKLIHYLDHCLTCRACESICPAEVPYGAMIDAARQFLKTNPAKLSIDNQKHKFISRLVSHPKLLKIAGYLLYFYQVLGLQKLARKAGITKLLGVNHYDTAIPKMVMPKTYKSFYAPQTDAQGNVALFVNCINPIFDSHTIDSIIHLLTVAGYGVYIPPKQACCGALALHQGDIDSVNRTMQNNVKYFSQYPISHIITFSSGCSLTLHEYQYQSNNDAIKAFSRSTMDIYPFLKQIKWPDTIYFEPLPKKVVLHSPCTLKNGLKFQDIPRQLLSLIPALEVVTLPSTLSCCGAAGQYFLDFPDTANALLQPIIKIMDDIQADYFLTSNLGCQLHIARQLKQVNLVHPLSILAKQIRFK